MRLHYVEDIDKMQYGFMPGRWTVESVFGLRKLNERFRVKNKYVLFFDLEKIFDQVPREVICSALRWKSAPFGEL